MEFGLKKIFCICICHLRGITWHTLLGGELEEVTQLGTPSPHILDNQTKVYDDDNDDDDDGSGLDHSIILQCLKNEDLHPAHTQESTKVYNKRPFRKNVYVS